MNGRAGTRAPVTLQSLMHAALLRRRAVIDQGHTDALRVFSGASEGLPGVYIDRLGPCAVMNVYHGLTPPSFDTNRGAAVALAVLAPLGVRAVYVKPFVKDRSRLGGQLPPEALSATPAAGEPLPETIHVREHGLTLEIRPYDGLSTGLFVDQRANRAFVSAWCADRAARYGNPPAVLNTFAYTCAFSAAAALGGAATTSVDVSRRYLQWGERNFTASGLDPSAHRFARMDTFEFFQYAKRKALRYDLVILDPPSFAAGSKRDGIAPFSAADDYARLAQQAAALLTPGGLLLASTNNAELCERDGAGLVARLKRGLSGRRTTPVPLPAAPPDVSQETGRFAARALLMG